VNEPTPQDKRRRCKRTKQEVERISKRICLPIDREVYEQIVDEPKWFRSYVDECRQKYPELFPPTFEQGYKCVGFCEPSKKMAEVKVRRVRTKAVNGQTETYQIVPCFVMPYMSGYTAEVEKALFLHFKYEVPFDGLVYVFGRDESYWYRMTQQFGSFSLVGTTAKGVEQLPEDVAADEKCTCWNGEDAYIATTVGNGCFWGASISLGADEPSLTQAYGVFKQEAQELHEDYEPKTVNTDGFKSTRNAWTALFAQSVLILCFLHGFTCAHQGIRIRDRARRLAIFPELAQRVWESYRQESYEAFIDKITVLQLWALHLRETLSEHCFNAVMKLCGRAHDYAVAYHHPSCLRTSNMLDRLMQKMDRYLFMMRYFHGHLASAERSIRAWALAQNFLPYCSRSKQREHFVSPAHRLNAMVYRDNWLENLLVSASLGGKAGRTQIPTE
jgi:hypothetical protein